MLKKGFFLIYIFCVQSKTSTTLYMATLGILAPVSFVRPWQTVGIWISIETRVVRVVARGSFSKYFARKLIA